MSKSRTSGSLAKISTSQTHGETRALTLLRLLSLSFVDFLAFGP